MPDFAGLVQDTYTSLGGAISTMAEDAGVLGNTQTTLTATATTLSDTANALTTQVSSAQDVDMAQTLSNLSLVQTQLQASYQVIAAHERADPGEIPAGRLSGKTFPVHLPLTPARPEWGACPQKAGPSVTMWARGKIPCPAP